jgi:hypothetical protein
MDGSMVKEGHGPRDVRVDTFPTKFKLGIDGFVLMRPLDQSEMPLGHLWSQTNAERPFATARSKNAPAPNGPTHSD